MPRPLHRNLTVQVIAQQISVLGVLMLTSKGAAGVTGSGFIVLASTLSAIRVVPGKAWRSCSAWTAS